MDLNDIQLPASMVTDFYKTHLIDAASAKPVKNAPVQDKAVKKSIQYLGKNQKGICLLVDYAKDVYLPDEQLSFLTSILQACRLNLGDVAIVNHHREKLSFAEICKQLGCTYLLGFGIDSTTIGLDEMEPFTVRQVNDCAVVCAPAAGQLNNNNPESKLLKSKLWACLKQLFNV